MESKAFVKMKYRIDKIPMSEQVVFKFQDLSQFANVFANQIETLKSYWPECPIVLVHRPDDACLGWWVKCGHFNITYPKYDKYYVDLKRMAFLIMRRNIGIIDAWLERTGDIPENNQELARILRIETPPAEYFQDYKQADIGVKVI